MRKLETIAVLVVVAVAFFLGGVAYGALTQTEQDAVEAARDTAMQIQLDAQALIDSPTLEPELTVKAQGIKDRANDVVELANLLLGEEQ